MNGHRQGMWAGIATLAVAGVIALAALGQPGQSAPGQSVAELKTIIVPPPPPPVDSGTVDLRDKKGPLIPHIPGVAMAPATEGLQVAELKTIIVPPPPPPPVDSGTVDLRDKKGPLIPHIPGVA